MRLPLFPNCFSNFLAENLVAKHKLVHLLANNYKLVLVNKQALCSNKQALVKRKSGLMLVFSLNTLLSLKNMDHFQTVSIIDFHFLRNILRAGCFNLREDLGVS